MIEGSWMFWKWCLVWITISFPFGAQLVQRLPPSVAPRGCDEGPFRLSSFQDPERPALPAGPALELEGPLINFGKG